MEEKAIEANKIAVMDANNTERFVIASKPNQGIDGKTYHRYDKVSGIRILKMTEEKK